MNPNKTGKIPRKSKQKRRPKTNGPKRIIQKLLPRSQQN